MQKPALPVERSHRFRSYLAALFLSVAGLGVTGYLYIRAVDQLRSLENAIQNAYLEWVSTIAGLDTIYRVARPIAESAAVYESQIERLRIALDRIAPKKVASAAFGNLVRERLANYHGVLSLAYDRATQIAPFMEGLTIIPGMTDESLERQAAQMREWFADATRNQNQSYRYYAIIMIANAIDETHALYEPEVRKLREILAALIEETIGDILRAYAIAGSIAALFFIAAILAFGLRLGAITDHLSRQEAQLREWNRTLEERVSSRTAHLEKTLKELSEAQDLLVDSEKKAVLGTMAANMSHELNSPLGAIASVGGSLKTFLLDELDDSLDQYQRLSPEDHAMFRRCLLLGSTRIGTEEAHPSRADVRMLADDLSKNGVADADSTAELLLMSGMDHAAELRDPHDQTRFRIPLLRALRSFLMLGYIGHIIEVSVEKAEMVVSALRSHLNGNADETATEFELRPELDSVLTLIGISRRPSIAVEWSVPAGFAVFGRRRQLYQVWFNLVKNAAQAIDYAGTIRLRAEKTTGSVLVAVEDDGPGIPIGYWDRVFTPFFTTKGDGQGQGLGLDLCKRIVEQHGGTIAFESRQGRTVFTVRLPEKSYKYRPV